MSPDWVHSIISIVPAVRFTIILVSPYSPSFYNLNVVIKNWDEWYFIITFKTGFICQIIVGRNTTISDIKTGVQSFITMYRPSLFEQFINSSKIIEEIAEISFFLRNNPVLDNPLHKKSFELLLSKVKNYSVEYDDAIEIIKRLY